MEFDSEFGQIFIQNNGFESFCRNFAAERQQNFYRTSYLKHATECMLHEGIMLEDSLNDLKFPPESNEIIELFTAPVILYKILIYFN